MVKKSPLLAVAKKENMSPKVSLILSFIHSKIFFISLNSTPINAIKKLTMELTMDASHPGYNTPLLLGGDEQLKKLS